MIKHVVRRWALAAVIVAGAVTSAAAAPGWIADPKTGCRAWDNYPNPDDRIQWSGPCVNGFADGEGTLRWFSKGDNYETDVGHYTRGKIAGHARADAGRGQFEGAFSDNRPNGQGVFRAKSGEVFSGRWVAGCFNEGGRKARFFATDAACGL